MRKTIVSTFILLATICEVFAQEQSTEQRLGLSFWENYNMYFVLGLLLIVIVLIFLLVRLTSRERIIKTIMGSKRVKDQMEKHQIEKHSSASLFTKPNKYELTERDIDQIVDRVLECKRLDKEESIDRSKPIKSVSNPSKFLKGKNGKYFSIVDSDSSNSYFKMFDEHNNQASFEFFGEDAKAIANRIFDNEVCVVVSGGYDNAKNVRNIKSGKIKFNGDKWEVVEPAEVELK